MACPWEIRRKYITECCQLRAVPRVVVAEELSKMKLASIFAIAVLTGCSNNYSAEDLAGKYALSGSGGIDTIELNADGTYTETYAAKGGQANHQEGTWTLETLQAGPTVALNDFLPPLATNVRRKGIYLLLVKSSLGGIYLITNIDLGEGYKKQT